MPIMTTLLRGLVQFVALYRKNALLALRSPVTTVLQLGAPLLCLGAVVALSWALEQNDFMRRSSSMRSSSLSPPPPKRVGDLPGCDASLFLTSDCVQFVYAPSNSSAVESVVSGIRRHNSPAIDSEKVIGLQTLEEMDEWFMQNPGRAMAGLYFDISEADSTPTRFVIQTNSTVKLFNGRFQDPNFYVQLPLQQAVEREIFRFLLRQTSDTDDGIPTSSVSPQGQNDVLSWKYTFQDMPSPSGTAGEGRTLQSHSVLAPFIFAAAMLSFGITMSAVVHESCNGLKTMLRTAGMIAPAYWMSWLIWDFTMAAISGLLFCACGIGLNIRIVASNSLGLVFAIFFLFQASMASLAYLLSWFMKEPRSATHISFGIFIVGWICQIVISFGYPYSPTTKVAQPVPYIAMSLLPWNILAKALMDLGGAAQNAGSSAVTTATGISWDARFSYCVGSQAEGSSSPASVGSTPDVAAYFATDCVMSLGESLEWLVAETLVLFCVVLALELFSSPAKNVLGRVSRCIWKQPAPTAPPSHPNKTTPVDKSVLAEEERLRSIKNFIQCEAHGKHNTHQWPAATTADAGVADGNTGSSRAENAPSSACCDTNGAPRQRDSHSSEDRSGESVHVFGISKRFRAGFQALRPFWCSLRRGEVFCLLGSNGAGKTTTINILTGVTAATEGEAYVEGRNVSTEMPDISKIMGVCPQFNVLWPVLTGREHMRLYTAIKGVSGLKGDIQGHIMKRLGEVGLLDAADVCTGCYSGGMQRRLSLALALLGDPKVIYLDEPTTGMDPINRRCVWNVIQNTKPAKSIVLTTHSLEEADVLGDQMAIMTSGQLQSIGTSLTLKRKFGAGYRVLITFVDGAEGQQGAAAAHSGSQPASKTNAEVKQRLRTSVKHAIIQRVMVLMTLEERPRSLQFRVPRQSDEALCELLEHLENNAAVWGILSIDVSLPTLEEVFLEVLASAQTKAEDGSWPGTDTEQTP